MRRVMARSSCWPPASPVGRDVVVRGERAHRPLLGAPASDAVVKSLHTCLKLRDPARRPEMARALLRSVWSAGPAPVCPAPLGTAQHSTSIAVSASASAFLR